jgi:hypothetical protein
MYSMVSCIFSCTSFKVLDLTLRSLTHFELILVQGKRQGSSFSLLYMWMFNFPRTICWRGCLFSNICFSFLCQKSDGCTYVDSCLGFLFYSIGLCVCFCANTMLFLLWWLCSIVWSQVLWYLQHYSLCSELLWLVKVFCASLWTLGLIFLCYWNFDRDLLNRYYFLFLWQHTGHSTITHSQFLQYRQCLNPSTTKKKKTLQYRQTKIFRILCFHSFLL